MSNIVIDWKLFKPTTKVRGKDISVEVRPLKSWAWLLLAPIMEKIPERNPGENSKDYLNRLTIEEKRNLESESIKLQQLAEKIFPDHVQMFEGVTINGMQPTAKELSEEMIFMGVVVEIMMHLVTISTIGEEDLKNSNGPSISQPLDSEEAR